MLKIENPKLLIASMVGSMIEWYDFTLVGALAYILSSLFFPDDSPLIALLKIFSIFATGFLARPLGAIVLGHIGDRYGRKNTLALSLLTISIATLLMSILPTYETIGIYASLLLVLLRLIQGFGSGGEHAGAILLLYESSSSHNRIYKTSLSILGIMAGMFLGFAISALLITVFDKQTLLNGMWRVPFFIGGVLGMFGLYIRFAIHIPENKLLKSKETFTKSKISPLNQLFKQCKTNLLLSMGLYWHSVVIFYAVYFYVPSYIAQTQTQFADAIAVIRSINMLFFLVMFVSISKLSDRIGEIKMMRCGAVAALFMSFPLMVFFNSGKLMMAALAMALFTLINVIYLVPVASMLSRLFPMDIRYTGISVAVNITSAIFGGSAPVIMAMITKLTGNNNYSSMYLILAALVATLCLYSNKIEKHWIS